MTIKKDHSKKNALKRLYHTKYELDKDFDFRVPRLKTDIHAYLHRLLTAVEAAFEQGRVVKYKGHELKFPSDRVYNKDEDDD